MVTYISHSPKQTESLGAKWGSEAVAGTVFALSGELGVGKTQLVKGLAYGLGTPARVHSPTFALINEYLGGRLPLFHIDLYRLNGPADILAAGLEEYLRPRTAVTVVEWAEKWFDGDSSALAASGVNLVRRVRIETLGENERRIEYEDFGD